MTEQGKCDKCGAEKWNYPLTGDVSPPNRHVIGGPECQCRQANARIRELEAERDALKENLEAAEKSCELKIDDMTINVPNFLRCVVRNAARIGRGRRGVAWARVADICGVGSTTAIKLCRAYGMDPDTGKALPANPEAPHAQ